MNFNFVSQPAHPAGGGRTPLIFVTDFEAKSSCRVNLKFWGAG